MTTTSKFDISWEGRQWLEWGGGEVNNIALKETGGFKFLSYNVYADRSCNSIRYTTTKQWLYRRKVLIEEIKCYNADIIALQDVDHYTDWWQPQLMLLGYDTLWKQRTCEEMEHHEGVVIAYRRDLFQLFKTVDIEFNRVGETEDVVVRRRCLTDNVGVIAFLQPFTSNFLRSAMCVTSAALYSGNQDPMVDIRMHQAIFLAKSIEVANRDFQVPVLIGVALNDSPDSGAYHIMRTGRKQLQPAVPKKCSVPTATAFCRGSARIYWLPPPLTEADPPILFYEIAWRPGGSRSLGYRATMRVTAGDCIQYSSVTNSLGVRRTIAEDMRSVLVTKLPSETPFEFRIRAVNEKGIGPWSEPGKPIVLPKPQRALPTGKLKHLHDLESVNMLREVELMNSCDINSTKAFLIDANNPQTALTPRTITGVPDLQISKARILPLSTNPRQGWTTKHQGEMDERIKLDLKNKRRLLHSAIMTKEGTYKESVSDSAEGSVACYDPDRPFDSQVFSGSEIAENKFSGSKESNVNDPNDEDENESFNYRVDEEYHCSDDDTYSDDDNSYISKLHKSTTSTPAVTIDALHLDTKSGSNFDGKLSSELVESSWEHQSSTTTLLLENSIVSNNSAKPPPLNRGGEVARKLNDDVMLDCRETIAAIGKPNIRQMHAINLRSAYEAYGVAGEPLFTCCHPEKGFQGVSCKDYIFFSSSTIKATKILSIPSLTQLQGDDPRENLRSHDPYWLYPMSDYSSMFNQYEKIGVDTLHHDFGKAASRTAIDTMKKKIEETLLENDGIDGKKIYGGSWVPYTITNSRRAHSWLPNESFCSERIALCGYFQFNNEFVSSEWS